ncbi:host cell division inhibitor Icd-like protein [Salmonella enterica]|nr:host cell division inhibitor Icd-like protein [Salmonella enterica]
MRNNRLLSLVDKNRLPVSTSGRYISCVIHMMTGFSSLNTVAGSRLISDMRFFCARNTTRTRIMAGRNGEAFVPAGFYSTSLLTLLRLATPFSSVVARLLKLTVGAVTMAVSASPRFSSSIRKLSLLSATEVRHA